MKHVIRNEKTNDKALEWWVEMHGDDVALCCQKEGEDEEHSIALIRGTDGVLIRNFIDDSLGLPTTKQMITTHADLLNEANATQTQG